MVMVDEQPITSQLHCDKDPEINKFFRTVIKNEGSDIHLKVSMVPRIRVRGKLKNTSASAITEEKME